MWSRSDWNLFGSVLGILVAFPVGGRMLREGANNPPPKPLPPSDPMQAIGAIPADMDLNLNLDAPPLPIEPLRYGSRPDEVYCPDGYYFRGPDRKLCSPDNRPVSVNLRDYGCRAGALIMTATDGGFGCYVPPLRNRYLTGRVQRFADGHMCWATDLIDGGEEACCDDAAGCIPIPVEITPTSTNPNGSPPPPRTYAQWRDAYPLRSAFQLLAGLVGGVVLAGAVGRRRRPSPRSASVETVPTVEEMGRPEGWKPGRRP